MPALRLVSRRWHAVFWGEPSLWRTLSLDLHKPELPPAAREQWHAGKRGLLQRVGSMVTAVDLECFPDKAGGPPAGEDATDAAVACLLQLQPRTLSRVALRWEAALPTAVLQALLRFSQALKVLEVSCLELAPAAAPLLAQFMQVWWARGSAVQPGPCASAASEPQASVRL